MFGGFIEFERRTFLVQFITVKPLTFYSTSDGTDLIQDILKKELSRQDSDILGQEGSLSIDDNGEFLTFEPNDTKNRQLHIPIEYLAYCGALRRIKKEAINQLNQDNLLIREYENVDLANRYPQYIIGPPIFVSIFHGFNNALCYLFITQNSDDSCLLVNKLMRAFKKNYEFTNNKNNQQNLNSNINNNQQIIESSIPISNSTVIIFFFKFVLKSNIYLFF